MPGFAVTDDPVEDPVRDLLAEAEAVLVDAMFEEIVRGLVRIANAVSDEPGQHESALDEDPASRPAHIPMSRARAMNRSPPCSADQ